MTFENGKQHNQHNDPSHSPPRGRRRLDRAFVGALLVGAGHSTPTLLWCSSFFFFF